MVRRLFDFRVLRQVAGLPLNVNITVEMCKVNYATSASKVGGLNDDKLKVGRVRKSQFHPNRHAVDI